VPDGGALAKVVELRHFRNSGCPLDLVALMGVTMLQLVLTHVGEAVIDGRHSELFEPIAPMIPRIVSPSVECARREFDPIEPDLGRIHDAVSLSRRR
jgi:hypothetical protein